MYSHNHIAQVSASNYPLPGFVHKRAFQPAPGSALNDVKKRKLENGVQTYQTPFLSETSFASLFTQPEESQYSAQPKPQFPPRVQPEAKTYTDHRQKFKARPIPKTLYKPATIQKVPERPLTIPQEFSLSSSSPSRFRQSGTRPETFKARPMPNFSRPWLPQNLLTPTKTRDLFSDDRGFESLSCEKSPSHHSISTPPAYRQFSTPHSTPRCFESRPNGPGFNCFALGGKIREFEPTIPMEIELHTSRRAQEREMFEEKLREHERWKESMMRAEAEEKARNEREEIKRIRKMAEFKARPMPNFRGRSMEWNRDNDAEGNLQNRFEDDMMDLE